MSRRILYFGKEAQAPYKGQPGSPMVHLDEDVNVQPSQPCLNQQHVHLLTPQQSLRYGPYRRPTPPKPTKFQPLPPFPAPPPLATGTVAPKSYVQPSSARDRQCAHPYVSMDSTSRQQWRPHLRTRGPSVAGGLDYALCSDNGFQKTARAAAVECEHVAVPQGHVI